MFPAQPSAGGAEGAVKGMEMMAVALLVWQMPRHMLNSC